MLLNQFDEFKSALESVLEKRYKVSVRQFGSDTNNPGVSFDFDTGSVGVHGALWRSLAFDIDAVDFNRRQALLHESHQPDTLHEFLHLLDAALTRIDQAASSP